MKYNEFLESKILKAQSFGFDALRESIHPKALPHQKDIIQWAAKGGRRAIFADFGLGKSMMQLEVARLSGEKALIIMPLGVRQEFKDDASWLDIELTYVRNMQEIHDCDTQIMITNYERVRDGNIDVNYFGCVSLDEASVLRSYGSKTYQTFLEKFKDVKYRYVATATPSPNKFKELIHYAGFLGVMDTGQALTRFFKRDSKKANHLTLYPHKEQEFWLWVSTWALFISKPSDLGYSDEGYDLPKLNITYHQVSVKDAEDEIDRDGQVSLMRNAAQSLQSAAKEKRISLSARVEKAKELIDNQHWIIWHDLEDERKQLQKIPDVCAVYGSQQDELKEDRLIRFKHGKERILAVKPSIAGSGCNFQKHCHNNIFLGVGYKFNDFIQAIHRTQRFQQKHTVNVHLIYTDAETNVIKTLESKWAAHDKMRATMRAIVKKYGLNQKGKMEQLKRSIGIKRQEVKGKNFTAVNNDCVAETSQMEPESADHIITSIPFSNHYEYTPSYNDFGHTNNDDHFFAQMDYLTPELLRILKPGRVASIHVKDRILFGNVTGMGMPTVNPFHAKTIFHYIKHGFAFMGQITIETDVVRENNQTYRLGWTEQCKDGTKMGVGSPEYLLLFRKLPSDTSKAYADLPVSKSKQEYQRGRWQIDARAKWNSSGDRFLSPREIRKYPVDQINKQFSQWMQQNTYDYKKHVDVALSMEKEDKLPATFETLRIPARYDHVWDDINRMRTLNTNQSQNREQNHVCPLQFDIVERSIERYSNPGELIVDPFAGLFTVPYTAIKMGRRGHGIELNEEYWGFGTRYCKEAEYKMSVPTLFDDLGKVAAL